MKYLLLAIVVLIVLIFMIIGIRPINHCCICDKAFWGKQEAINDKPACYKCREIWFVEYYPKCVETKWEDRNKVR